jgi:hypothetical protein
MLKQPEETEAQPTVPTIKLEIAAESATLIISLGSGLFIQQVLSAETMQQICKVWLESRKELMKQQRLVADVLKTKR